MSRSRFESFNSFIVRRRRLIILAWVLALAVSATQIPVFFGAVNYNIASANLGGPTNTESQLAQNVLNEEFPANATGSNNNGIVVVLQTSQPYSMPVQQAFLALSNSVASDPVLSGNFTGTDSIYSTEASLLTSTASSLLPQVSLLASSTGSWALASAAVSNATASSLSSAPLFHANATALTLFLSSFNNGTTPAQVRLAAGKLVSEVTTADYPLVLNRALSQNFVSQNDDTMLVIFNFASQPSPNQIAAFQTDIKDSQVGAVGSYWVTGNAVIQQDVSKVFGPAVGVTLVPGVIASIAIVGLLLLSPLAALIPVMIGGFSIAIALPLIYVGVVKLGHGTLGFLTPTLTILLVLGLSVDYSVLQLRRVREERINGKSKEESVAISLKWAGQAVLTAGITVVVAYLVMALTKVPLFSDVGTGIAIAVSVLVAAALTLLPALELTLGDRIFWPSLSRAHPPTRPSRISRLTEKALKRKVAVVVIIGGLALGAFYVSQQVPGGADFFRLLPDFPSNHGLTVITNNFGSALTGPTMLLVTTTSPITYGSDQFNLTLLSAIDKITATAAGVTGVVSITGPTRPYGSAFNYTGLQQMPPPEKSQYLKGMLSNIGLNNETAVINLGLSADPESQSAVSILKSVEARVNSLQLPAGTVIFYGGTTQATKDSTSFIEGIIPQVILTLAAAIYVILLIQLRSAFTPIRLILTILCSVAFAVAALVLIFFYGLGEPIFDFAPLFVIVTMLGVGIDYDIFIVTRIREEVLSGKSDDEAIESALGKSWVTILGLGLVLATVFSSVVFTGIPMLQEIGLVVAAAVMIDVSTIILFFVPSLMGIAQRFNWWPSKISKPDQTKVDET